MALKKKKKLLIYLISVSVLLLLVNISIDFIPKKPEPVRHVITKSEIENRVESLLDDYAIDESWRKRIVISADRKDSLSFILNVLLPKDVLITDLLKNFNIYFPEKELEVKAKERTIHNYTSVFIYVNDVLFYQVNFKKQNKLKRAYSGITLLVKDADELSDGRFDELCGLNFTFCALIRPGKKSLSLTRKLSENKKEYALYFNEFIEDENYQIAGGLSRVRLKSSVISITTDFIDAEAYFINKRGELFRSLIFNFVRDEFAKRNRKFLSLVKYKSLSSNSLSEVKSKFRFYEESLKGKGASVFTIEAEELLGIKSEVEKYLMRGNEIKPFTLLR